MRFPLPRATWLSHRGLRRFKLGWGTTKKLINIFKATGPGIGYSDHSKGLHNAFFANTLRHKIGSLVSFFIPTTSLTLKIDQPNTNAAACASTTPSPGRKLLGW